VATFKVEMKRVNKYKSKRVDYDYHNFASKLEASLYQWLKLREKNGEISDIRSQETVYLTKARIIYKPDFSYTDNKTKERIYAESKGIETPEWRIKRRLWQHYGVGKLEVYKGKYDNFKLSETLVVLDSTTNAV
jgi:hypothetical protein